MTFGEQNSQQEGFDQMDYAVERGVNFFDTAEVYSIPTRAETYGKTEEIIGNWFAQNNKRKDVILATKICAKSEGNSWIRDGGPNLIFDKKNINEAVDGSLKRLKTDYIDLYQLHWPERNVNMFGRLGYEHDDNEDEWNKIEDVLSELQKYLSLIHI